MMSCTATSMISLSKLHNCPAHVSVETIFKDRADARVPTKISLVEFASNDQREKALKLLTGQIVRDSTGTPLKIKRALTAFQRERNTSLIKAEDILKKTGIDDAQIDWKGRQITSKGMPAFVQGKSESGGRFLPPHAALKLE